MTPLLWIMLACLGFGLVLLTLYFFRVEKRPNE